MKTKMQTQDDLLDEMVPDRGRSGIYKSDDQHPWLVPVKMPFTKINGFLEEFEFRKYIGWEAPVSQVHVFRAEPNLITRPLLRIERINARKNGRDKYGETVYLLNEYRNLVTATVTEMVRSRRYWLFGKETTYPRTVHFCGIITDGTIEDALSLLGEKSQFVHTIYSYFPYTEAAIVYKIPENVSVCEWIRAETEAAKVGFQEEFEKI